MIPREQLEAMEFNEISRGLFMKDLSDGTRLYRDYRNAVKYSYAYRLNKRVPAEMFKELRAIEIIERRLSENLNLSKLSAYC